MTRKKRAWEILEVAEEGDVVSRLFDIFILGLIFLNVTAVILVSVDRLEAKYAAYFDTFELFSVADLRIPGPSLVLH